jgi:hypothetical protein
MKTAFIVTSSIQVSNQYPLTYSANRTFFTAEERFRQTVMTVNSLNFLSQPDTAIYVIDTSDNYEQYRSLLIYQNNLKFISVKDEFPEIYQTVTTHPHKSRCETLLLSSFLMKYSKEMSDFDYFVKLTGRYSLDTSFKKDIFNQDNVNKIFFKHKLSWDWNDQWGDSFKIVDQRVSQGDNKINQYCTGVFAWGKGKTKQMLDIFIGISSILTNPSLSHYDIETLIYYFTDSYRNDIIETDWIICGWLGADGTFFRY